MSIRRLIGCKYIEYDIENLRIFEPEGGVESWSQRLFLEKNKTKESLG